MSTPTLTVPTQSTPRAEDAANESGAAIDTFSGYVPQALPLELIEKWAHSKPNSYSSQQKSQDVVVSTSKQEPEVIEILDESSRDESVAAITERGVAKDGSSTTPTLTFSDLGLPSHSSPACESALLASISPPKPSSESVEMIADAALSPLQFEGVCCAIQRHQRILLLQGKWKRAGFFLGDAAGIGKGRQMAAVIKDSFCRGRPRHLWISVSRDLARDAKRDLDAIGCVGVPVLEAEDIFSSKSSKGLGSNNTNSRGVLFVTYSLLVSGKRMEQIIQWLITGGVSALHSVEQEQSFDGCVMLDEAHKAKNLDADTTTAKLVIALQDRLPMARVLYASATGVSSLQHMAYLTRLGLIGSSVYPDFATFQKTLSNRGMGSLELLALELKQMGAFVARSLSWEGAEFHTREIALSPEQRDQYNDAVSWWNFAKKELDYALQTVGPGGSNGMLWRIFWSAHQRFFREVAICAKIDFVVATAKKHMEDGCAIVIGLQSTGEASAQVAMKELSDQYGKIEFSDILLPTLVSTARSILTNFVNDHFPVKPQIPEPPHVPELSSDASDVMKAYVAHLQAENTRIKSLPPPQPIPQLVERQKILLNAAKSLALPPNPLDDLIDRLGGTDLVAELTGRSGRIVRHKDGKHYQYTRRIQESSNQKVLGLSMPKNTEDFDKLNIVEKKRFMEKNKKVAIISDAASTGISLHAAAGSGNCHRRRVHLTIELPWAADAAIQQLGRSHRSGQTSAPVYEMIVTELGGERRFGAAVAKRMANLGALTKGDRRAATGSDLSGFDIDSKYGQRALTRLLQSFDVLSISNAPSRNSSVLLEEYTKQNLPESVSMDDTQLRIHALGVVQQCMIDVDILSEHGRQKKVDVKKFLNRLAQIPVQKQKLTFSLFMSTLDDVVAEAKATGAFEGSVEDIRATRIDLDGIPEKLATDKRSGAETKLIRLILDRGVSLKAMLAQSLHDAGIDADDERSRVAKSGFYLSKRLVAGRQLILYAKRKVDPTDRGEYKPDPLGLMVVTRPNTGKNQCEMSTIDLRFKYKLMVSSKNLKKDVNGHKCEGEGAVDHVELLRANHPRVAKEWEKAYTDSFSLVVNAGLAPRRSKLGLVTGAVLHVLPVLEKAVVMSRQAERALKVARVEISGSGKRFVGIRFPLDGAVLAELKTLLATKTEVSKQHISHTTEFKDDAYMPLDPKLSKWATSEPKTMRSFFAVASKPSSAAKRKADVIPLNSTPKNNKMKSTSSNQASKPTKKKSKTSASIKSFFGARR